MAKWMLLLLVVFAVAMTTVSGSHFRRRFGSRRGHSFGGYGGFGGYGDFGGYGGNYGGFGGRGGYGRFSNRGFSFRRGRHGFGDFGYGRGYGFY